MRRLIKNKRGISAVIGAIFTVVIFLAGFSFIMWQVTQYDTHQQTIYDRNREDQEQKNEIIEISQLTTEGTTNILFDVTNEGSVTAHVVSLWITEYSGTTETSHFGPLPNSTYINPSSTVSFNVSLPGGLIVDKMYLVKVVTERGNVAVQGWASLSTTITIEYSPNSVYRNDTVTISGILTRTSEGIGISGKTINLFISNASSWDPIGQPVTIGDGSYSLEWIVPSDMPSGNYQFRAVFNADSEYPGCSVESSAIGVEVLSDPIVTVMCIPSVVKKNETVTLSGVLTSDGMGISGKQINLYRSNGGGWTSIGSAVTSLGTGAYAYAWQVPSDLSSGSYQFRAEFAGDSQYPGAYGVSGSVQVLDPSIGMSLLYYPPTVRRNEIITIYGALTSEGSGVGSKQINLYRSSGSDWISIGTDTTSSDGSYSYSWNVTDLSPGSYRLRASYAGDSYYPACIVESDYFELAVPVVGLSLMYYPPTVHRNENVTIYGVLTSDGLGLGSKQINLYRSSGSDWVLIGSDSTSVDGSYSYSWNVTDLAIGSYRLKASFTGDAYYPSCSTESNYLEVTATIMSLSLLYYPPTVHRNENVTIYGLLTSDGLGVGGKQIDLYRSSGSNWILIGSDATSIDGAYSYDWNVSDLSPGSYRLKASFAGDSYYSACSAESDYVDIPIPVTALTLTYYPPSVGKHDNVTISGVLTSDGVSVGSKQLSLYWSNSTNWVQIGTTTTASSGAYSYSWKVSGLSAGNYRLKTSFAGDSYFPACFIESDSRGLEVLEDAIPPGTGGGLNVGPFVLLFSNSSFQYTSSSNPTTPSAAFQIDNDRTNLLFWIQLKNQANKAIQISSLSFFLVEVRELVSQGVPGSTEYERYFHIVNNSSTSSGLVAFGDYSQTIASNETATLKFGASAVGGTSFLSGEPLHQNGGGDDWENLSWTFLVVFWRYEGEANTFGQTISYVAIRTTI